MCCSLWLAATQPVLSRRFWVLGWIAGPSKAVSETFFALYDRVHPLSSPPRRRRFLLGRWLRHQQERKYRAAHRGRGIHARPTTRRPLQVGKRRLARVSTRTSAPISDEPGQNVVLIAPKVGKQPQSTFTVVAVNRPDYRRRTSTLSQSARGCCPLGLCDRARSRGRG